VIHNTNVKRGSRRRGIPLKRPYQSSLREEQAQGTRERILEALVRTMANGLATLSVPAVAREAGVSVPTVYRHFGSKAGLLEALGPFVIAKAGLVPGAVPATLDDIDAPLREVFRNLDSMDATLRAAMTSQLGRDVRAAGMPWRRAIHRDPIRHSAPDLPEADIERLTDLSIVLTSSGAFRVYRDYLDMDPDQAAALAAWALRALVRGAGTPPRDR
jgi:hypothetical protein